MADYEDLVFDQGADIAIELHLVNTDGSKKDLTNHNVAAKMKRGYNSDSSETIEFTTIVPDPPSDGVLTLSLTNEQTDALNTRGRYVYDVEITSSGGTKTRVLEGQLEITPGVTQ